MSPADDALFWWLLLAAARLVPMALLTPVLGGRWLGINARISLVLAMAALVVWSLAAGTGGQGGGSAAGHDPWQAFVEASATQRLAALAIEGVRGAVLGFAVALVFAGIRAGLGLTWLAVAGNDQPTPRRSNQPELAAVLGVAIFLAIDGHHAVLGAVARSYQYWPPAVGAAGLDPAVRDFLLTRVVVESARSLTTAVAIAAPLLATSVLSNLALAWLQRVHPAMPTPGTRSAGAAALGVAVLALAIATVAVAVVERLVALPESIIGLLR